MENIKALIVDDSEINQLILNKMLTVLGVRSDVALSGKEALEKIHAQTYNLVFMDVQMPEMDGYQTTQLIRSTHTAKDLPIIAVTANADSQDKARCLSAGMNAYLSKPVRQSDLATIMDSLNSKNLGQTRTASEEESSENMRFYHKLNSDLPFMETMVTSFKSGTRELLDALKLAADRKDSSVIPALNHKLKGLLSATEASESLKTLQNLEAAINIGDWMQVRDTLIKLEQEVQTKTESMTSFINERKHSGNTEMGVRDD